MFAVGQLVYAPATGDIAEKLIAFGVDDHAGLRDDEKFFLCQILEIVSEVSVKVGLRVHNADQAGNVLVWYVPPKSVRRISIDNAERVLFSADKEREHPRFYQNLWYEYRMEKLAAASLVLRHDKDARTLYHVHFVNSGDHPASARDGYALVSHDSLVGLGRYDKTIGTVANVPIESLYIPGTSMAVTGSFVDFKTQHE